MNHAYSFRFYRSQSTQLNIRLPGEMRNKCKILHGLHGRIMYCRCSSQCPSHETWRICCLCDAETFKLISDGDNCDSKKWTGSCGGAYGVIWRSLLLAGVWFQPPWRRFNINLLYKKVHKICTLNAISKDNSAINYVTLQHGNVSFASTLMVHKLG